VALKGACAGSVSQMQCGGGIHGRAGLRWSKSSENQFLLGGLLSFLQGLQ
jgi:hypothetical protein